MHKNRQNLESSFGWCVIPRPYVGREEREIGLGEHVTLSLMEPYKNMGLNVTTDNF